MSEFKFLCPECGQKISCDAGLSGNQIGCPACQKSITIPASPMAAPAAVMSSDAPPRVTSAPPPPMRQPAPARPSASAAAKPPEADPSRYSWLAIASLVSSVFVVLGFIPGIICGHLARAKMRKDIFLMGEKMANAGLIISYCVMIITLVFAVTGFAVRWHYHGARTVLATADAPPAPASRIVDQVTVPDGEEDHDFEGRVERASVIAGKKGRRSLRGGYFSYSMKVLPQEPMSLNCVYWGGEPKGRYFDIAIDNQVIATQKLDHNVPNKFFGVEYKIPAALTRGKTRVTVVFQARPAWTAGTVYGCQTLKR
jgi:hypothetical protein